MRIPKQDVKYVVACHDEEKGMPFCLLGYHHSSKHNALKEQEKLQRHSHYELFIAEVIIRPLEKVSSRSLKRKAA